MKIIRTHLDTINCGFACVQFSARKIGAPGFGSLDWNPYPIQTAWTRLFQSGSLQQVSVSWGPKWQCQDWCNATQPYIEHFSIWARAAYIRIGRGSPLKVGAGHISYVTRYCGTELIKYNVSKHVHPDGNSGLLKSPPPLSCCIADNIA